MTVVIFGVDNDETHSILPKKNLRGKIREFVQSEEGKVGVKAPLTPGVATGSLLLVQAVVGTPQAEAWMCQFNHECESGICSQGTCMP